MSKVTLTYWPLRGLCQPIEYILEYGGLAHDINRVDADQWAAQKPKLPLDFPNLPHIVDGNVRMSESLAICKYLAKKCGLMPETAEEVITSDIAEGAVSDFRMMIFTLMFVPDYETAKLDYPEKAKTKLALFEKVFASRPWLAGSRITWLDFVLYESLDINAMYVPGILDDFPQVRAYKAKIESLPKIRAYRKSSRFSAWPITGGPGPRWGRTPGETIHTKSML